ncbi:hypothetical protein [Halorarum halobium]|uniref:hypothetical protein n=1 Tax=Halorarum halobium TaxID=3075121 RepID=UPI0028A77600|nr:hypothetical protein [Halobaculum sp. XH14]
MTAHRFTITFDLEDGSQRQLRFQPMLVEGGWKRIELRRETPEGPWYQEEVESVRELTLDAEPVAQSMAFPGP